MILQTNSYENDRLLLDCFKNFYNSEERAIAIYRLLKIKMGSHTTGLHSVPSCDFFIAQVCLGYHCLSYALSVDGDTASVCIAELWKH